MPIVIGIAHDPARRETIENATWYAVESVVRAALNANPHSNQGVRNAIRGILGDRWKDEPDDWFEYTLITHGFDWTQEERDKVVELFGGA